jgi:hypothetical protein
MKNYIATALIIVLTVAVSWFAFGLGKNTNEAIALDAFAQCLADKGWTMYGAYWCPHCQNEKATFGDSFRYVNYVECTKEPGLCTSAGIEGYPTWITKDGRKFAGEQGVKKLAEASGCQLPVNK